MHYFAKLNPIQQIQIFRHLPKNLEAAYGNLSILMITEMNSKNEITMTRKKMQMLLGDKSAKRVQYLMPILQKLGFWVKIKRSLYMINPELVNCVKNSMVPGLIGIYRSYEGLQIELDSYCRTLSFNKNFNKTIEIDLQKDYETRVKQGIQEIDSMNQKIIVSLTKQLDAKDKQINILLQMLSGEEVSDTDKNKISHLRLVNPIVKK